MTVDEAKAVIDEDDAQPSQLHMLNGHERAHAELDYAIAVLRKVQAGDDYAADVCEALERLG